MYVTKPMYGKLKFRVKKKCFIYSLNPFIFAALYNIVYGRPCNVRVHGIKTNAVKKETWRKKSNSIRFLSFELCNDNNKRIMQ